MRISDWSSDVCSSDLNQRRRNKTPEKRLAVIARQPPDLDMIVGQLAPHRKQQDSDQIDDLRARLRRHCVAFGLPGLDEAERKSGVEGKSVSVRVECGGRRNIKQTNLRKHKDLK